MKSKTLLNGNFTLPSIFWRGIGWWGQHQRFWWIGVALFTVMWLGYDVGRVVTRADLVRMGGTSAGLMSYEKLEEEIAAGNAGRLLITSRQAARFVDANGMAWEVPDFGRQVNRSMLENLREHHIPVDGGISIDLAPVKTTASDVMVTAMLDIAVRLGFVAFYVFIIYIILKHLSSKNGSRFRKMTGANRPSVRIGDVAGHGNVKREVLEIVEYLRDASKYSAVGANPPRGILMHGPPGNGKTLIAKAIAGEADAYFLEQSASAFVQVYAGEGAKAVRQLFDEARKNKPCVIFIDEIDAMGESRSSASHGEYKQTLNELLTQMDGFKDNGGIVVIAATNRLEALDEALVRPGRFDRKVHVPLPSQSDRLEILKVHAGKLPSVSANLEHWARQTPGFSGASLASLVNEAAIEAARSGATVVTDLEFAAARDRVMLGVKDSSRMTSPRDKRFVAYHELGHALMRIHVGGEVEKVSIQPRGRSLGVTVSAANGNDSGLFTEQELRNEVLVLMGGRAAEEVFCDAITTGAADDMARASALARKALLTYGFGSHGPYVPESDGMIRDMEVKARQWVHSAYTNAIEVMKAHKEAMDALAPVLVEKEELEGAMLKEAFGSGQGV